jgi:hypothetical protein
VRKENKSAFGFAVDPIFKDFRKPTDKMVNRARFWADWKKRRDAKKPTK